MDDENIYLNPDVNVYKVTNRKDAVAAAAPDALGGPKLKRFQDIMADLYNEKDGQLKKKKLSDQKIGQKPPEKAEKAEAKAFLKRVVSVGWRHKKHVDAPYECMGYAIGPKIKITLNGNEDYPIEKLKTTLLALYKTEENRTHFENCIICIGTSDYRVITKYTDNDEKECDFWTFSRSKLRNKSHALNIYILTTKLKAGDENFPPLSGPRNDSKMVYQRTSDPKSTHLSLASNSPMKNLKQLPKKLSTDSILTISRVDSEKNQTFESRDGFSKYKGLQTRVSDSTSDFPSSSSPASSVPSPSYSILSKYSSFAPLNELKLAKQPLPLSESSKANPPEKAADLFRKPLDKPPSKLTINALNLSVPQISENKLQFSKHILGRGAPGVVTKGKYLELDVAIKSMMSGKHDKLILKEIKLLDQLRHPNIISIMAVCQSATQFHIVMEFFDSRSLYEIVFPKSSIEKYQTDIVSKNKIAHQLCLAIAYLHLQPVPIIHRDIKPSNILVNEHLMLKVCDLGLGKCKMLNDNLQSTHSGVVCDTYLFMAPEIILHYEEANTSSDIWACTLVELYSEKTVWKVNRYSPLLMTLTVYLTQGKTPNTDSIPVFMRKDLQNCFSYDPTRRPTVQQLLHSFKNK